MAAIGVGGMSGVLVGEGWYGLAYVADTTYPPYWMGEIVAGVLLTGGVAILCWRHLRTVGYAVCVGAVMATTFVALYRLDLITRFP